jgi:hypothetical protein
MHCRIIILINLFRKGLASAMPWIWIAWAMELLPDGAAGLFGFKES